MSPIKVYIYDMAGSPYGRLESQETVKRQHDQEINTLRNFDIV